MYEAQNKGMILANRRRVNMSKSNAAGENSVCETEKLKKQCGVVFQRHVVNCFDWLIAGTR